MLSSQVIVISSSCSSDSSSSSSVIGYVIDFEVQGRVMQDVQGMRSVGANDLFICVFTPTLAVVKVQVRGGGKYQSVWIKEDSQVREYVVEVLEILGGGGGGVLLFAQHLGARLF